MTDVALHIRIFEPEPSDDFVEKRTKAIADIGARFAKRKNTGDILQLANELATGALPKVSLPTTVANDVEAAIREQSTAFVRDGQELQMSVCALIAALQNIVAAKPTASPLTNTEYLAVGLWSALSFQAARTEPKLEALRTQVLISSRHLALEASVNARRRREVPDFAIKVPEPVDWNKFADQIRNGVSKATEALRLNAALDREELDLLWWSLSEWSALLDAKLSSASPASAAIAAGMEAARLLRRLPSEGHKHLVFRCVGISEPTNLAGLIQSIGSDLGKLAKGLETDANLTIAPAVFPLLTALASGKAHAPKAKHTLAEWAERALLETTILQLAATPAAVL